MKNKLKFNKIMIQLKNDFNILNFLFFLFEINNYKINIKC